MELSLTLVLKALGIENDRRVVRGLRNTGFELISVEELQSKCAESDSSTG